MTRAPHGALADTSGKGRETPIGWTAADDAELDVLVHRLVFDYHEHRQRCEACKPEPCPHLERWKRHKAGCRACQGDAPLTFGPPCAQHKLFLEHNRGGCLRCSPCPHLQRAITVVVDWVEARKLLSRAQALRLAQQSLVA